MGRPLLPIDADEVYELAKIGCRTEEIADWFGCSRDTIEKRFSAELTKGWAEVRKSLRRWQLDAARKGNATMLVWLGKQILKQRDISEEEIKEAVELRKELHPIDNNTMVELIRKAMDPVKAAKEAANHGSNGCDQASREIIVEARKDQPTQ